MIEASRLATSVHPRGCGEHVHLPAQENLSAGSSPRVRGTPPHQELNPQYYRFIPAGAGNTLTPKPGIAAPAVPPRGCGEHFKEIGYLVSVYGSSPRVRGTHMVIPIITIKIRFIPAGAGNTWLSLRAHELTAVHPRGCGEHLITVLEKAREYGSSPRVRGTRPCTWPTAGASRFIPAGAGNTIGVL